ncbi:MAG: IclR family transcriptional regulator [Paracoccaceae bacterium]|nr:IclR family transcriptional regulator [Paracoccaceae bacterium]
MDKATTSDGTVGKALELLDRVAEKKRPVRFTELLAGSPHPKATLHRLLQTLLSQEMLSYDRERQTYSLGLRLVTLAHAAWRQSSLAPIARPFLDALAARLGETIHLAQLDNGQVLYLDKRNAADPIEMFSQAGKTGPGYCTGIGKAMLAYLPDEQRRMAIQQQGYFAHTHHTITNASALSDELAIIREQGMAFDREEHETGIICVAVPILSHKGRPIGGLSLTSSTQRAALADLHKFAPILHEQAQEISSAAEHWQFPFP